MIIPIPLLHNEQLGTEMCQVEIFACVVSTLYILFLLEFNIKPKKVPKVTVGDERVKIAYQEQIRTAWASK